VPSVSKKQHNFMAAVANNPAFAKKAGVPQSVGQEFTKADKGKTFKKGGDTMAESKKEMEMRHAKTLGKIAKEEAKEASGYKRGGKVKKMAMGGMGAMPAQSNVGGAMRGMDRAAAMSGRTMPTPSMRPPMPAAAGTAPGMKAGGFTRSADGIAKKGKTKAMQITMKRGGKC
jgi:hypothetical protein